MNCILYSGIAEVRPRSGVAEMLGIPSITNCRKVELNDGKVTVEGW